MYVVVRIYDAGIQRGAVFFVITERASDRRWTIPPPPCTRWHAMIIFSIHSIVHMYKVSTFSLERAARFN